MNITIGFECCISVGGGAAGMRRDVRQKRGDAALSAINEGALFCPSSARVYLNRLTT